MDELTCGLGGLPSALKKSQFARLCWIGALVLVFLIPIEMISGLVSERQSRHQEAVAEVSSKWGNPQVITGPVLLIPFMERTAGSRGQPPAARRQAVFLPKQLIVKGRIQTESRHRGIFSVPVYQLTSSFEGEFEQPNLSGLGIDPATVDWNAAQLVFDITDVRAISADTTVSWNEKKSAFLPGTTGAIAGNSGIHAFVPVNPAEPRFRFSLSLLLNGSSSLDVVPFAEETTVNLTSNAQSPSFQGNWLPAERTVSEKGFDATWRISYLGRDYPQSWVSGAEIRKAIEASRFGVDLNDPVDQYRMAERSVKYADLFVLLTFVSVWLVEIVARVRVHPVQYLMQGAALCVFYLLELSLSEHASFPAAYAVAGGLIIAMVTAYARILFSKWLQSGVVALGVSGLYFYLFILLTNEDAALVVGSIGLFVILGIIMFATRRIDWYEAGEQNPV